MWSDEWAAVAVRLNDIPALQHAPGVRSARLGVANSNTAVQDRERAGGCLVPRESGDITVFIDATRVVVWR
jgi:hypothetical protein